MVIFFSFKKLFSFATHPGWLSLLLFALLGQNIFGYSWNRNESHIKWKVAETEHFRFYYAKHLEPEAEYIASISESIYQEKIKRYNIQLPGKVEFIIREDIVANGWANAYQNTMNIWITDWGIPLRSTHNWLKDVITHEFSHLVSIQAGSKFPSSIFGLVIGYQDYYNEDIQSSLTSVVPFTSQPNWFAEGVAQYESELSGHDSWDSHRDMILRVAVLNDSLLSYARMGTFAGKGLHYEQGPYTQGYGFTRYLAGTYGDAVILKLWAENARLHRQTLSASLKRVLGKSGPELWGDWQNKLKQDYTEMLQQIGEPVEGKKLSKHSFFNNYPHWDAKGENIYLVSNKGKQGFGASLYKYQLADSVDEKEKMQRVGAPVRGYFDVKDSVFYFSSGKNHNKYGESKLDIYQYDAKVEKPFISFGKDKAEKRWTKNLNAIMPNLSADGKKITFVRSVRSNFYLCVAELDGKGEFRSDDIKTLFPNPKDMEGKFGFNVYTPVFSPDGKQILFSYYEGQSQNIAIINSDGTGFKDLLKRPYHDQEPIWHPDGKSFLFVSDSTGIFNIYGYQLESGRSMGVTNVIGGAFSPALSPDGKDLAYINYDKDGFSLYLLEDWSPRIGSPRVKMVAPEDSAVLEPQEFSGIGEKYLGIPNRFIIQPMLFGQEITSKEKDALEGETKWLGGASIFLNDPVYKNELALGGLFELGNGLDYFAAEPGLLNPDKESELFLSYFNHSTPVSMGIGLFRKNLVTFDTIVNQSVNNLDENDTSLSNQAISLNSAQLNFQYSLFQGDQMGDPMKNSFLSLTLGRSVNSFNFFEVPFDFPFYKTFTVMPALWFYGVTPGSKSNVAPKGMAGYAAYSYNYSNLFRGGTFRETFKFENGVIKPVFRDYSLHELDMGLDYGFSVPWSKWSSLRFSIAIGSILSWKEHENEVDTLNSFFERGVFIRGYPYLEDTENLLMRGENTTVLGLDYNQALINDIYKEYWILFLEDVYAQIFWESGRAWNGKLKDIGLWEAENWDESKVNSSFRQTIGWGLKLNSRIYHNYPFNVYFEAATALNDVRNSEGKLISIPKIDMFGIPTGATRVSFGISLGFYNGLLSGSKPNFTPSHSQRKIKRQFGR